MIDLSIHKLAQDQISANAVGTIANQQRWSTDIPKQHEIQGLIEKAIESYEFPESGQGYIKLPEEACELVLSGAAPLRDRIVLTGGDRTFSSPRDFGEDDFHVRIHRGEPHAVLKRRVALEIGKPPGRALIPDWVAAIVYTAEAFLADPDLLESEEQEFIEGCYTHSLITILSGKGPKAPVSSRRFVRNLAGGNATFNDMSLEELKAMAKEIVEYERNWITVG